MSAHVWVINGPNLNLLGRREPEVYGRATLAQIEASLVEHGARRGVSVACFQSNHEGALVDRVQAARDGAQGLIVNFGAYSHTSIALRDALTFAALPTIEVHLSNVHSRAGFRHTLLTAAVATGSITGLGADGYRLALDALCARLGATPDSAVPDHKGEHRP